MKNPEEAVVWSCLAQLQCCPGLCKHICNWRGAFFSACLRNLWADEQCLVTFTCDGVIRCGVTLGQELLRTKAMVYLHVLALSPVSNLSI